MCSLLKKRYAICVTSATYATNDTTRIHNDYKLDFSSLLSVLPSPEVRTCLPSNPQGCTLWFSFRSMFPTYWEDDDKKYIHIRLKLGANAIAYSPITYLLNKRISIRKMFKDYKFAKTTLIFIGNGSPWWMS